MISDLNDESNPFKRTTTKLENKKAFSPLETHSKINGFQNATDVRDDEVHNSLESESPLPVSSPLVSNEARPNESADIKNVVTYKKVRLVHKPPAKSGLKLKQNIESEDISRILVNKQETNSEDGTENDQKSSILDISDENYYQHNYERQVESKDDLHLESLNFEDIVPSKSKKKTRKGDKIEFYKKDGHN